VRQPVKRGPPSKMDPAGLRRRGDVRARDCYVASGVRDLPVRFMTGFTCALLRYWVMARAVAPLWRRSRGPLARPPLLAAAARQPGMLHAIE